MSRATCITGLFRKNCVEGGNEGTSVTTDSFLRCIRSESVISSRGIRSESVTSGRGLFQGASVTSESILSNRGTRSESFTSARGVLQGSVSSRTPPGSVSSAQGLFSFSEGPARSAKRRLNSAIHKMSAGKPLYSGEPNDCGSLLVYAQCIAAKFAAKNRTRSVFRAWKLRTEAEAADHASHAYLAESLWQDHARSRKAATFRQWRFHRVLADKQTNEAAETMQGTLQKRFQECLEAEARHDSLAGGSMTTHWISLRQARIRRLRQFLRLWRQQLCVRRCARVQRQLRLRRSLRHWRSSSTRQSCRSERRLDGARDFAAQESFAFGLAVVTRQCFAQDFALLRAVVDAWSSHTLVRPVPVARTPIVGRWRSKGTAIPTKVTPSPAKVSKPPRIPLGEATNLIDKENQPHGVRFENGQTEVW